MHHQGYFGHSYFRVIVNIAGEYNRVQESSVKIITSRHMNIKERKFFILAKEGRNPTELRASEIQGPDHTWAQSPKGGLGAKEREPEIYGDFSWPHEEQKIPSFGAPYLGLC